MTPFLEALRVGPLLADGAMGSYLFELTGRLSEENHVYEAFGADRPEVLRQVGLAYLQAGSRCLTTNTFAGNRACLAASRPRAPHRRAERRGGGRRPRRRRRVLPGRRPGPGALLRPRLGGPHAGWRRVR